MKTIADFPAFEIVDLELNIITMTPETLNRDTGMKFCVAKETIRHGTLYPGVSPSCAAYYAMSYNEDPVEAEARCDRLGHEKYWINNCGAMITADKQAKGVRFLLKPGQKILMNGVLLEVFQKGNSEHYGLKEIAAE